MLRGIAETKFVPVWGLLKPADCELVYVWQACQQTRCWWCFVWRRYMWPSEPRVVSQSLRDAVPRGKYSCVVLGGRRILKKNCLCHSVVFCYNGAQRYEQFLEVRQLYRALILLSVAPCLPSASVSLIFMVLYYICILIFFCWHPSHYLLVSWGWCPWRGWLTIVLQCCDTVGWVMWPIKLSPKWPIMCRVGR